MYMHARAYIHAHIHTYIHTYIAHIHKHTHTHTCMPTQTLMPTHTHTDTKTLTHTHTQTHTHSPKGMQMTLSAEPTQKLGAFERTYSMQGNTLSVCERQKFDASLREHVLARVCFHILLAR